jgi:hypothetical protein
MQFVLSDIIIAVEVVSWATEMMSVLICFLEQALSQIHRNLGGQLFAVLQCEQKINS